ncbi:MAG: hypothetical protein HYX50_01130 [Chloroflexi bacterium]|nr:hypothetical protein [Chloroflexota bacterium]
MIAFTAVDAEELARAIVAEHDQDARERRWIWRLRDAKLTERAARIKAKLDAAAELPAGPLSGWA